MIAVEKNLVSVGRLVADLQCSRNKILSTAAKLGIVPDLILNGVHYFGPAAVESITEAVGKVQNFRSNIVVK